MRGRRAIQGMTPRARRSRRAWRAWWPRRRQSTDQPGDSIIAARGAVSTPAGFLIFMSAAGVYYLENEAQPENFKSIFHSLWWAVVTLTTVGYGYAVWCQYCS